MHKKTTLLAATAIAMMPALGAHAQSGELVLYCSVDEEWCRVMSEALTRETGIDVLLTRRSSGET